MCISFAVDVLLTYIGCVSELQGKRFFASAEVLLSYIRAVSKLPLNCVCAAALLLLGYS